MPLIRRLIACSLLLALPSAPASAELMLSQMVVELGTGKGPRADIEVSNQGKERAYVVVEPSEIVAAGTPAEQRLREKNPEKLGLLVSPGRMILEPGQRKLLRIATIGRPSERERVYRITVKPTVGDVSADRSGLKLLIGYDVLVLTRPAVAQPRLSGTRSGRTLKIRNDGAFSVELAQGKQCRAKTDCQSLGGKRLYAGAEWQVPLPGDGIAEFAVISPSGTSRQTF